MSRPPAAREGGPRAVRRPRRRVRLLLAVGATVAALALLEIGGRIVAASTGRERGVGFDAVLGWHMLPHVEKVGEFWSGREPGRTNSHGWRDAERPLQKPAGTQRIATLGDSFTFGQGVDPPERFTELLAAATGFEVLNFGACAFGTDQQVLVYEHEAAAFEPDVVLLVTFLGNDLDDIRNDRQSGWSKPYFRLREGRLELVPPVQTLATVLRTRSYLAEFVFQALERDRPAWRRAPEWETADTVPLYAALVRRLAAGVAQRAARLLVVFVHPFAHAAGHVRHERTDELLRLMDEAGVAALDTHAPFAAHPDPAALYLPHLHWTPAGHAILAQCIAAELQRRGWLPGGLPR